MRAPMFICCLAALSSFAFSQEARVAQTDSVAVTLPEVLIETRVPAQSRKFSRADIEHSNAPDLAAFLRQVAGLDLRADGTAGGWIAPRIDGSNPNQVLVLVNGVKWNDVGSGEANLSRIPLEWVTAIEIYGGAHAAAAGEAIGGILAIETKFPDDQYESLALRAATTRQHLTLTHSTQKSALRLSAGFARDTGHGDYRFRITEWDGNGPFTQFLGREFRRRNNALERDKLLARADVRLSSRQSLALSAWSERAEFGMPGYLAPRPTPEAHQTERHHALSASYRAAATNTSWQLAASRQTQAKEYEDGDPLSLIRRSQESSSRALLEAAAGLVRAGWTLQSGAGVEQESVDSGLLLHHRATRDKWHAFLQARKFWITRRALTLSTQAGARVEKFGEHQPLLLPQISLAANHGLRLRKSLTLSASQAYRAPTFYSLFWNDELLARGNPELRPETSALLQAEAALETQAVYRTRIALRAVDNSVRDLIYWRQAFDGRWTPLNLKRASLRTLQLSGAQTLMPRRLDAQGSLTWLEARDISGDRLTHKKYLPYRPARSARLAVFLTLNRWRAGAHYTWSARQMVLETNSKWLPAYDLLDLELKTTAEFGNLRLEMELRCENVLDRDYRIVRHAPMPLRTFWISLELSHFRPTPKS